MNLSTKVGPIQMKNPLFLASGILDESSESMLRVIKNGAGGVVTKSIGMNPRNGYGNPCVVELECGILNAMGLPNPGIKEYGNEIIELRSKTDAPIIGSVFASNENDFAELGIAMEGYGVNAIELNVSCPHVTDYGLEIGSDAGSVKRIVKAVKKKIKIPIFVKISPNVDTKIAIESEADGIVAINSARAMKIDIDAKMPILSNKVGGYSGPAIKPIGVRCVYEIATATNIPIIGVGGIMNGKDVIEYLMAGASAVQIGSGVHYRGIEIFKKLKEEIKEWMTKNGYENISELIGIALEK